MFKHAWSSAPLLAGNLQLLLSKVAGTKFDVFSLIMQHGQGTANTALVFHAKKLLALQEADLPYAVRHLNLFSFALCTDHQIFESTENAKLPLQ